MRHNFTVGGSNLEDKACAGINDLKALAGFRVDSILAAQGVEGFGPWGLGQSSRGAAPGCHGCRHVLIS